jgi:hypothetical protein
VTTAIIAGVLFAAGIVGLTLWFRSPARLTPAPPRAEEAIAILCAAYGIQRPRVLWVRPPHLDCAGGKGYLVGGQCVAGTWAANGITCAHPDGARFSDGGLPHEFGHEAYHQRTGNIATEAGHTAEFYEEDERARAALRAAGL